MKYRSRPSLILQETIFSARFSTALLSQAELPPGVIQMEGCGTTSIPESSTVSQMLESPAPHCPGGGGLSSQTKHTEDLFMMV